MTMKHLKRIFTGTLPLFLLLWAGMMGILWGLTQEKLQNDVQSSVVSARQNVESRYQTIWAGETPEVQRAAILTSWLPNQLYSYNGILQFRLYTADGQELARSQIVNSTASLPKAGVYDWHLWLDPVLSAEEQLALAERLREDDQLRNFFGTVGGLVTEEETDARWCDVVGVVDQEQQVIYPKTITYVYADREVTLVDTESSFFEGKELTSMRFESLRLDSALVGYSVFPQELLDQWQKLEREMDLLFAGIDTLPDNFSSASVSSNTICYPLSDGTILGCGFSFSSTHQAMEELKSTALFTLLAAIAMALFTDWRQRLAIQRERNFARAAAHELKTPLAVLRAHAEALREDIAPEKREQYLDVVLSESDRMAALVGHLLELSRLESGRTSSREPVALAPLVREVLSPLALPMEQKNLRLQAELEEVSLTGDRARLGEAVENLLSNALRHAVPGGVIQVKLERLGSRARLTVYNDGPNIPSEELPRLWEPFYRADPSRSRDSGGTGLGLAITGKIVLAHHGQYWAENRPGGVAFIMEFPIS